MPEFSLNAKYVEELFNYYFYSIIAERGKIGALQFVCILVMASVFLSNLFLYLSERMIIYLKTHSVKKIRKEAFNKVSSLELAYFSDKRKGDIVSRITSDVLQVEMSVINTLTVIIKEPILLTVYVIFLFTMSAHLTLFTLIVLPISGLLISLIVKKLKKAAAESQVSMGMLVSMIDEALSGLRIVKAFNATSYVQQKFDRENTRYTSLIRIVSNRMSLVGPLSESMGVFVVIGILLYGGTLVLQQNSDLSASEFITYIILYSQILRPVKSISNAFSQVHRGIASGERVLELIDRKSAIEDKPNAVVLDAFRQHITFENVGFAYEEKQILQNISFTLHKGQTLALVGPSGGGKSTIADLIPRFYEPNAGVIRIDGINIQDVTIESLRAKMGIVTQETILFNDTIYNNIAFGLDTVSEADVVRAAKIANAHEFILHTEKGYQTVIGDRGMKLSGGQRQRINIARAVLKNPPILIMDEATSALDTESEQLVQEALSKLMENRTSLVIAHRLSTIQNADVILVIQNGAIVELGNHESLINKQNGLYKKLNQMQL
jgi:subfamily B ATP-binding cassette protein MsbA